MVMNTRDIQIPTRGLTLRDQVELGRRMTTENDMAARETLILSCVPLVKSIAKTLICNRYSNFDDMFQDGILGVLEAVDRYDYTKNIMFTTFSYPFIFRKITDGIRRQFPVRITESEYFRSSLIKSTIKSFLNTYQIEPTNEQLAELTGIPFTEILFLRKLTVNSITVSYQDYINTHDIYSSRSDVAIWFEKAITKQSNKQLVYDALNILNENERDIILKRFLCEEAKTPLKELAELQGVSMMTISNREKKALKKLLGYFVTNNIEFEDFI